MAVRARPAASLVAIWRDSIGTPYVFMGRRHEALRFLPGVMVFPGGRIEQFEDTPPVALDEPSACEVRFERPAGPTPGALAAAALRECLEETGLEAAPHIAGQLRYIGRAITPPHLPIRYDTHFLLAHLQSSATPPLPQQPSDGELVETAWFNQAQLTSHKLHHVTRHILDFCLALPAITTLAMSDRTLIADRRPKHWRGQDPLRSRNLRKASEAKP
ncbi:MAG: NUDIX domain-containing protein [Hyphomicrobiales bacterium]